MKIFNVVFLFMIAFTGLAMNQNEKVFIADIFSSSKVLDPAEVKSAGQYIILSHILRPLTKLNIHAQIEGDLVRSWRIKNNFTTFIFVIKEAVKWSDGTKITADDVIASLSRQMKLNTANHYDFSNISEVGKLKEDTFVIKLKKPNVSFIRQISYPEFGVLSKEDSQNDGRDLKLKKTSGPYILMDSSNEGFRLIKNNYYDDFSKNAPKRVQFQWSDIKKKVAGIKNGSIDFVIPFSKLTLELHNKIESNKNISISYPHIGYTFWITINPRSESLKNKSIRNWIQSILYSQNIEIKSIGPSWYKAKQLFLPDGPGRPEESVINKIWEKLLKSPRPQNLPQSLSVLDGGGFPFSEQVVLKFKKYGIKLNITTTKSADEYFRYLNEKVFDLVFTHNDFSSADLHENLQTTFNPQHPLIFTDVKDSQYQVILNQALSIVEDEKRHDVYKKIAIDILEKGYIAPIAYSKILFYHKKNVDISNWSILFPEVSLWKIK